jgi:hypothetical protein
MQQQERETELLTTKLEYQRATGTPLPSSTTTPRTPMPGVSDTHELARTRAKAPSASRTGPAANSREFVRTVQTGSRVAALSLALRASQEEVERLRGMIQDVESLKNAKPALSENAMTLTLDLPFDQWCDEAEERVVEEVALVAGVEEDQIQILRVSQGSVVLDFLIDAPDLGTCVRRLEADVSDPNGQLATSISAVSFKGPPALEARTLKKKYSP